MGIETYSWVLWKQCSVVKMWSGWNDASTKWRAMSMVQRINLFRRNIGHRSSAHESELKNLSCDFITKQQQLWHIELTLMLNSAHQNWQLHKVHTGERRNNAWWTKMKVKIRRETTTQVCRLPFCVHKSHMTSRFRFITVSANHSFNCFGEPPQTDLFAGQNNIITWVSVGQRLWHF